MIEFRKRFWIRRDRERFFMMGFILVCIISSFMTTWWNFSDKITAEGRLVMPQTKITKSKEAELLREERLTPGGSKLLDIAPALEEIQKEGEKEEGR